MYLGPLHGIHLESWTLTNEGTVVTLQVLELLTSPTLSSLVGQLSETLHDLQSLPTQAAADRCVLQLVMAFGPRQQAA